jgi:hypothetical protein
MKYLFYFAVMLFSVNTVLSQPVLTTNTIPVIGEKLSFTHCDTIGVKPGASGASVSWDFSNLKLKTDGASKYIYEIIEPSKGLQYAKFSTANYAFKSGDGYSYYKVNGSTLDRMGTGFAEGYELLDNYELNGKYPFTYQNTFTDNFSGIILTVADGVEINMKRGGTINVIADGYGTLKLPAGTFDNVLRLKIVQLINDTVDINIPGVPPVVTTTETTTYHWQKDGFKFGFLSISIVKNIQNVMGQLTTTYSNVVVVQDATPQEEKKLSPPEITSPGVNEQVNPPFKVKWTKSELQNIIKVFSDLKEDITYTLQVSEDPSWNNQNKIKEYDAGLATEYNVTDKFATSNLSLRVKAQFGDITSNWSESQSIVWKEQSVEKPSAPVLTSPPDGATGLDYDKLTFTWTGNEDEVELEVFNDNATISYRGPNVQSYTVEDLSPNTTYQWRARQFNSASDSSDWSSNRTFTTKSSTSVNDLNSSDNFKIFPNPGNGNFELNYSLNSSDNIELKIYDIKGNIVYKEFLGLIIQGENSLQIDLSNLAKGVYLVNLNGQKNKFVQRVVVE